MIEIQTRYQTKLELRQQRALNMFQAFFITSHLLSRSDQTWNLLSFEWLSLMCNSFLLVPVKAVLRYFRSLSLPKKQAEASFQTKWQHGEVLLQESFLCLPVSCPAPGFLIRWPGMQRQNETTQETGCYEGQTDCHGLLQLPFSSEAELTLRRPLGAAACLARGQHKQRGIWALPHYRAQRRHDETSAKVW